MKLGMPAQPWTYHASGNIQCWQPVIGSSPQGHAPWKHLALGAQEWSDCLQWGLVTLQARQCDCKASLCRQHAHSFLVMCGAGTLVTFNRLASRLMAIAAVLFLALCTCCLSPLLQANQTIVEVQQLFDGLSRDYPNLDPRKLLDDLHKTLENVRRLHIGCGRHEPPTGRPCRADCFALQTHNRCFCRHVPMCLHAMYVRRPHS